MPLLKERGHPWYWNEAFLVEIFCWIKPKSKSDIWAHSNKKAMLDARLLKSRTFGLGLTNHRGRNQRYSFQIDLDYVSSTIQFLQFWNQNVVNIILLVVKSLKVKSGFNSKLIEKISRWRHHWNIRNLCVKLKISPLLGRPQESQGCQKMRHYPLNLDLMVWCSNVKPKRK